MLGTKERMASATRRAIFQSMLGIEIAVSLL